MMPVGAENGYRCAKCGGVTVTIHRDAGVTPMFLACRAEGHGSHCDGRATSLGYPAIVSTVWGPVCWEWYRPNDDELAAIEVPETRDHVERGGLLLRRIGP